MKKIILMILFLGITGIAYGAESRTDGEALAAFVTTMEAAAEEDPDSSAATAPDEGDALDKLVPGLPKPPRITDGDRLLLRKAQQRAAKATHERRASLAFAEGLAAIAGLPNES